LVNNPKIKKENVALFDNQPYWEQKINEITNGNEVIDAKNNIDDNILQS